MLRVPVVDLMLFTLFVLVSLAVPSLCAAVSEDRANTPGFIAELTANRVINKTSEDAAKKIDTRIISHTGAATDYRGATVYNNAVLNPPPVPSGLTTQFLIQLQNASTANLSLFQNGSFIGFSIEMSLVDHILGSNSNNLQAPFLNLMANLAKRSGRVNIRIGGNTQDTAVLVDSTPDGKILERNITAGSRPTRTTPLIYTPDLLYMMANISALVNVHWFIGVPFLLNDTATRLAVVRSSQEILGDHLMGLQVGNEVDMYQRHGHYATYSPSDYNNNFGGFVNDMEAANLPGINLLVGPNIAYAYWTAEDVWNTGFVSKYDTNLAYLSVEKYPTNNCAAQFKHYSTPVVDPQTIFPDFLTHTGKFSGNQVIQRFINSTQFAVQNGKRLVMMETNTASCGGFPGISDAFGAALWGIDYAFQMAVNNFGFAMIHVGGETVSYNPFSPPPTSSAFHKWTVGPMYYTAIVTAESIGPSNVTQVLDLGANGGNDYTPAYAFYENGNPVRIGIINYVTDPTGASDLHVQIAMSGSSIHQSSVQVKYLLGDSVSLKGNFTWAGQTFGDAFTSDGRPLGKETIITIACDTTMNLCTIPVPAPSYALVFLTGAAPMYGSVSGAIPSGMTAAPKRVSVLVLATAMLLLSI